MSEGSAIAIDLNGARRSSRFEEVHLQISRSLALALNYNLGYNLRKVEMQLKNHSACWGSKLLRNKPVSKSASGIDCSPDEKWLRKWCSIKVCMIITHPSDAWLKPRTLLKLRRSLLLRWSEGDTYYYTRINVWLSIAGAEILFQVKWQIYALSWINPAAPRLRNNCEK